jgi:hypothetical protein
MVPVSAILRHVQDEPGVNWGEWWDLNPRHPGPQPGALPTELHSPYLIGFKYTDLQIKIKKTFHLHEIPFG